MNVWIITMEEAYEGDHFQGVFGSLHAAKRSCSKEWGWKFPWVRDNPERISYTWRSGDTIAITRHRVET